MADYMVDNEEWMLTDIQISEFELKNFTLTKDSICSPKWKRTQLPVIHKVPAFKVVIMAKRSCSYFVTNLIVPIFLVLFISIASLGIDARDDHRPEIQLNVILSFVFFQSVLAAVMPQTRGSPRLCRYVMYSMLVATVELILTFAIRGVHNFAESTKIKPDKFISKIILIPSVSQIISSCYTKLVLNASSVHSRKRARDLYQMPMWTEILVSLLSCALIYLK